MSSKYFKDKLKHSAFRSFPSGRERLIKSLSGGVEGKPHSSKEGRKAAAERKFSRIVERGQPPIDPRSPLKKGNVMTPLKKKPKN